MIKRILLAILGFFMIFFGLGVIEIGFTDPEYINDTGSRVGACIGGICLIAGGITLIAYHGTMLYKQYKKNSKKHQIAKELRSEVCPDFYIIKEDNTEMGKLLRSFRNDYASFFDHPGVLQNDMIQKDATQMYWHILSLQKARLDQKGLGLEFSSERLGYGGMPPIRENTYFDGKYKITEVSETIQAKQKFTKQNGKKLFTRKSVETADYRILGAAEKTSTQVICPNCGSPSSKEDLIDGCDYCGTKFTIEDLDNRVSDFGLQHDCAVEYAKYKERRAKFIPLVALIVGVPTFVYVVIASAINASKEEGYGPLVGIAGVMMAALVVTPLIIAMAEMLFITIGFPIIQAFASFRFMGKSMIKKMEKQNVTNQRWEAQIRQHDPLFSMNGFFSSLQNKLAVIHYARGPADASSFVESQTAEQQVAYYIPSYQNIFDMQVELIQLTGYQVNEFIQEMHVAVRLTLFHEVKGKVKKRKETVRMILVKDSACKSQAVCAPAFTNCRQCGAPMSLLSGRTCNYCGHARRLAEYDWAIRYYQAMG